MFVTLALFLLLLSPSDFCPEPPPLATPRCSDDGLEWSPVEDEDLYEYRIYESGLWYTDVPVGTEWLAVGCVEITHLFTITAIDRLNNESNLSDIVTYTPGQQWDCVIENRPECPNRCEHVCDVWEDDECTAAHTEPPGCVWCRPPIGGVEIWEEDE